MPTKSNSYRPGTGNRSNSSRPGNHRNSGQRQNHGPAPQSRSSAQLNRPSAPQAAAAKAAEPSVKSLVLPPRITVRDLAEKMGCSPIELIKQLMNAGVMANINQEIDYDTAAIVSTDMGFEITEYKEPELVVEVQEEQPTAAPNRRTVYSEEEQKYLRERPPVVTILGHVDHGKTSLLDAIRDSNQAAHEAGFITQHIGAYQVTAQDKLITFLDTPGHEAFTAMRARGANLTDIAVLVVAADDGVQPQTKEAINHARSAQVPIIIALNKIDLPTANQERVKQQLADVGLVVEDYGGDTICVPVSAKAKKGIDDLLGMILLVAEMANYKANPRRNPTGVVIEGRQDSQRGPTATLLVQEGTLKIGDALLVGTCAGKIRAMFDYQNKPIKRATPSAPVVVIGLNGVPQAGDHFEVVENERIARERAASLLQASRESAAAPAQAISLDEIFAQAQAGQIQTLNLILKADVQGSLEPIRGSLEKLEVGELKVRIVHEGVGAISESDVSLATADHAIIIGFNVNIDPAAARQAEQNKIDIRTYNIIYRVIEDVQSALTGMLAPTFHEVSQGKAVVRQVFSITKAGKIAGSQVQEGKALRNAQVRVLRGDKVLFEGKVSSLKRFTEDVREVNTGMECGIGIEGFDDLMPNDIIEFYTMEQDKR
ncbi:MAG: translation initiation factor IF-2 [Chloroflexi bacterium]|nr:translation initiation factor IF-2 [Chloroflexota bacterium]